MKPSHRPEFNALATRLQTIAAGRPAVFFINPGNWGDSLIREGAEAFLRWANISYVPIRAKDIHKGRLTIETAKAATGHPDPIMIYNGSGALTTHYDILPRLANLATAFDTVVILPSTFAIPIDRNLFPKDTHFFVPDHFQSQEYMPDSFFCHDMAFFLDIASAAPIEPHGLFFREDAEAPKDGFIPPKSNVDLSRLGRAHTPVDRLLERIGRYAQVSTNRLHIAIPAIMLGRRVYMAPNDYFKIKAIFDSSIKSHYPNAYFFNSAKECLSHIS